MNNPFSLHGVPSMIDHHFREILPRFTGPLIGLYRKLGVSPNQITAVGLAISFVASYLITEKMFFAAIVVWWFGRLLDGTDGIFARSTGQTSSYGAFLDILFDMASYSAMVIGFNVAFPQYQLHWIIILFMYVLCITGALGLGNLEDKDKIPGRDNRGLRLAAGIAEGGETGIAYTLFLLLPSAIGVLSQIWIAVLFLTIVARIFIARNELK